MILIYAFYFLKLTSLKWPLWCMVHSCKCDQTLTVTLQQTLISGSNFDPDILFRPLSCYKQMWLYSEPSCS